MPGENQQRESFRMIEHELTGLRNAILARQIAAIECHTATLSGLLVQLTALPKNAGGTDSELRAVHDLARNLLVLLRKSRRMVSAIAAVYRFLSDSERSTVLELR